MYNYRIMSIEEVQAKAAKWGASLGRNMFARQQSAAHSFVHQFTATEIAENAVHSARNQATEFEIHTMNYQTWLPAFASAYTDAYKAEQTAYEMRTRSTQPRQQEEW
jgi:hypothetical protein